jgi:hypothetical protein
MNDREMAARLKYAVKSQPVPPELAAKVRVRLDEAQRGRKGWSWMAWAPVAAALAIAVALGSAYRDGHFRFTPGQRESFMASLLTKVSPPMRAGLDDHLHCSVYGNVPKDVPDRGIATQHLPRKFAPMLAIVEAAVPKPFQLYSAHVCERNRRRFVHFQLKTDSKLLSVIVTRRGAGESFVREKIAPALAASGTPIYEAGARRFELAAVESGDYLAYVVSDLPAERNRSVMLAMAPQLVETLARL